MSDINSIDTFFALAAAKKESRKVEKRLLNIIEDVETRVGVQGPQGPQGPTGETGRQGMAGTRGPEGSPGRDGADGQQGPIGDQGEKGDTGPRGETGQSGEQGETGLQGVQGEQGEKGDTGPQGESGGQGPQGDRGDAGAQGQKGEKGEAGVAGPKGDAGEKGDRGEIGPAGPAGEQGLKGDKGEPGKDGADVDRKEIDKYVNELFDSMHQQLDKKQIELNEALDVNQTNELEEFKKKITKLVSDNIQKHKNMIDAKVSSRDWASSAGGGSVNILQMDDVEFKKRHQVEGDAILIFDETKQKFISESFNDIIERLQVGMEVQYDRLVDTEGDFIYIGEAVPGSARDAAVWRIKRVYEIGDDIEIIWADNSASFDKVWNDSATYEYN